MNLLEQAGVHEVQLPEPDPERENETHPPRSRREPQMSNLWILDPDPGAKSHSAWYASDGPETPPGSLTSLGARFIAAGVVVVITGGGSLHMSDLCDCTSCHRLTLLAAQRLAEYEGRSSAAAWCAGALGENP